MGRRTTAGRVVSAGGLVYRRRGADVDVVLAGRRRSTGDMVWGIPKGHVEEGESARETAVREVLEETGIRGEIEAELGDIEYNYSAAGGGGRRRVFKQVHFFLMRAVGGNFADRDAEMDAVRWFPIQGAEAVVTYENERVLVRRARVLIDLGAP